MVAKEEEETILLNNNNEEAGRTMIKLQYERFLEEIAFMATLKVKEKADGAHKMRLGLRSAQHTARELRRVDTAMDATRHLFHTFISKHHEVLQTVLSSPSSSLMNFNSDMGNELFKALVKHHGEEEKDRLFQKLTKDKLTWLPLAAHFERDVATCFKFSQLSVLHYELFVVENAFLQKLTELAKARDGRDLSNLKLFATPLVFWSNRLEHILKQGTQPEYGNPYEEWRMHSYLCSEVLLSTYSVFRNIFDEDMEMMETSLDVQCFDSTYAMICSNWGSKLQHRRYGRSTAALLESWEAINLTGSGDTPKDFIYRVIYVRDWDVLSWILDQPRPKWSLKYPTAAQVDPDGTDDLTSQSWIRGYGLFWLALRLTDVQLMDLLWTNYGLKTRRAIIDMRVNIPNEEEYNGNIAIKGWMEEVEKSKEENRINIKETLTEYYNQCTKIIVTEFAGFHETGEDPEEDRARKREILFRVVKGTKVHDWIALEDIFGELLEIAKVWK